MDGMDRMEWSAKRARKYIKYGESKEIPYKTGIVMIVCGSLLKISDALFIRAFIHD